MFVLLIKLLSLTVCFGILIVSLNTIFCPFFHLYTEISQKDWSQKCSLKSCKSTGEHVYGPCLSYESIEHAFCPFVDTFPTDSKNTENGAAKSPDCNKLHSYSMFLPGELENN